MSSLEYVKKLYNPYRYTINKNATIINSSSGTFVIKKQNKDLFTLFNYLESRGFTGYPEIVSNYRGEDNIFEYIDDVLVPKEQKTEDFASLLASLHNKTVYYKKVTSDNYANIKENIDNNITFFKFSYEELFNSILLKEYYSPSEYLFMRNFFKLRQVLNFCEYHVNNWYESVSQNTRERVSVVHNNLSTEHFRKNYQKEAFISWDDYVIDTPVLDFVKLYQTSFDKLDFDIFLEKYLSHFELLESEKEMLFILISIPFTIEFTDNELTNVQNVSNLLKYIKITEDLIRPYYPEKKEE